MKKVLVILAVLAMTGFASAAMLNNPEPFNYADGTVLWTGSAPVDGWEGWGSGSGATGWSGGNDTTTVYSQSAVVTSKGGSWWGYGLLFNHNNLVTSLPDNGTLNTELTVDVLSAGVDQGVIKIEFYDAAGNQLSVAAWDPVDLSGLGTYTFSAKTPLNATKITPVVGVTGVGAVGVYDNIALSVPEPATMALLGLGGLLLRRKK